MFAAAKGDSEVVGALLAAEADRNVRVKMTGGAPVLLACAGNGELAMAHGAVGVQPVIVSPPALHQHPGPQQRDKFPAGTGRTAGLQRRNQCLDGNACGDGLQAPRPPDAC